MKKTLNILIILLFALLSIFNIHTTYYVFNKSDLLNNYNYSLTNEKSNYNNNITNPMYPNFKYILNNSYTKHRVNRMRTGWGYQKYLSDINSTFDEESYDNGTASKEYTILNLNTLNYAKTVDDFKNNYKTLELEIMLSYLIYNSTNVTSSASPAVIAKFDSEDSYKSTTFSLNTIQSDYISIFSKRNNSSNNHQVEMFYKTSFSGNYLQMKIKTSSYLEYNKGSAYGHGAMIGFKPKSVSFKSSYDLNSFKKTIINNGKKTIEYTSYTGAAIDSEEKLKSSDFQGEWNESTGTWQSGKEPKPTGKANKSEIEKLLRERAPTTFGDQWNSYKQYGVTFDLYNWNNVDNTVDTVFMLNNTEFVRYTTKINLKVDQSYWDMSYLKRLEILPGKVVDLNDVSKTMNDVPELIQKDGKQTFIYHNTVIVQFASNSINKNERLLVNGEDAEVWRNVFVATLTDGRNDESSTMEEDNTYEIAVEVDGKLKFSRTIQINSLNPNVDFKWMGWDPQNTPGDKNKYDQWVLTQPFINGEKNELYDPYINPETGVRIQSIFVNEKPLSKPFLIDPKDRYGQLIGGDVQDDPLRWGYFAEAYVVNKGIKYLYDDEQLKQFSKIERVEIDPVTFQEVGSKTQVKINNEVQFSNPGTWHYIFYLKDFVDQSSWGSNSIHNPPINKDIRAIQGTVIHKIITLDSDAKNYRRFLDLESSKKNSKIHEWFTVTSGGHLRSFMIANAIITSADALQLIKYEQIVKYWRQYVSAAINGHMTYNPETDDRLNLSDWQPIYFPMKQTEEIAAKAYITRKIKEQMFSFKGSAIEKDYIIESTQGHIPLNDMELSKFVSISEDNPIEQLDVTVIATPESLLLVGNLEFQINNDIKYDPDLEISLSDVKFKTQEGNFSNWPEENKKAFLENYLLGYVGQTLDQYRIAKNETLKQIPEKDKDGKPTGNFIDKQIPEYKYAKDYAIFIDGMKLDITQEPNINEYIDQFLNVAKKRVMWVRINAVRGTTLLSGATSYQVINDPKSNVKPPIKPLPEKPDPEIPGPGGEKPNKKLFGGIWWLVTIPAIAIIAITLFAVVKRKRKLKGYKLK
ncbi:hypothetical protein [Entomoplasma ellychniae]|nr:hypothetical protein [Entomoplasma ellychniae]